MLADGGYLYLTVPSLDELPFGYGDGRLLGLLQNAHNLLFDRKTLTAYLAQGGFEIVAIRRNLRVLAKKVGEPHRAPWKDAAHARRNLRLVRNSERFYQYFWRGLRKICRIAGLSKDTYFRVTQAIGCLVSSESRAEKRNFLRTGI